LNEGAASAEIVVPQPSVSARCGEAPHNSRKSSNLFIIRAFPTRVKRPPEFAACRSTLFVQVLKRVNACGEVARRERKSSD